MRNYSVLAIAALSVAAASASHAAVSALGFTDGTGTSSVDQYEGIAGSGWVDGNGATSGSGWVAPSSSMFNASVTNTSPLTAGSGNYLSFGQVVLDDDGSGQSRNGIYRRYDGGSLTTKNDIAFDLRVDQRIGFDNQFNDSINLHESNTGGTSSAGSNTQTSWQISFRGNSAVSYYNGTSSVTIATSDFSWTTSIPYRFLIQSDPSTETWSFVIKNAGTGATLYTSPTGLDWRSTGSNPGVNGGYVHFMPGVFRGAGQTGSTITLALDNISIAAVPEPASLGLIGLGATVLVRRRRVG